MKVPFYHQLTPEDQEKFKALMPEGWKPPKWDFNGDNYRHNWETLGEVDKLMRKPPHKPKRNKKW